MDPDDRGGGQLSPTDAARRLAEVESARRAMAELSPPRWLMWVQLPGAFAAMIVGGRPRYRGREVWDVLDLLPPFSRAVVGAVVVAVIVGYMVGLILVAGVRVSAGKLSYRRRAWKWQMPRYPRMLGRRTDPFGWVNGQHAAAWLGPMLPSDPRLRIAAAEAWLDPTLLPAPRLRICAAALVCAEARVPYVRDALGLDNKSMSEHLAPRSRRATWTPGRRGD